MLIPLQQCVPTNTSKCKQIRHMNTVYMAMSGCRLSTRMDNPLAATYLNILPNQSQVTTVKYLHTTWSIKDSFFPGNHFWFFSTKNSELKLRMSCYENWCMLFHFQRCRIACQTDKRAFVTVDVTFYVVGFCSCLCC